MHYETPTFTSDSERMIFVSMRLPQRGAPWDLFACNSDGRDILQLSVGSPKGMSSACLSVDGQYAYYMEGGTFHRARLDSGEDTEIGHMDGACHHPYYRGSRSFDGRWYISMVKTRDNKIALVRWDLETGGYAIVVEADGLNHPKANPGGPEFQIGAKYRQPDGSIESIPICVEIDTLKPVALRLSLIHI